MVVQAARGLTLACSGLSPPSSALPPPKRTHLAPLAPKKKVPPLAAILSAASSSACGGTGHARAQTARSWAPRGRGRAAHPGVAASSDRAEARPAARSTPARLPGELPPLPRSLKEPRKERRRVSKSTSESRKRPPRPSPTTQDGVGGGCARSQLARPCAAPPPPPTLQEVAFEHTQNSIREPRSAWCWDIF